MKTPPRAIRPNNAMVDASGTALTLRSSTAKSLPLASVFVSTRPRLRVFVVAVHRNECCSQTPGVARSNVDEASFPSIVYLMVGSLTGYRLLNQPEIS